MVVQTKQLISIEGIEGAGKSTVASYIQDYFNARDISFCHTREPGGTPLAEKIRHLILHTHTNEAICKETELLLIFAARAQHLQEVILPALNRGQWVLCDRFIDASYAYQGGGRGIDLSIITQLDEWVVAKHYPKLTLLLDIDPQLGLERAQSRGGNFDRIEHEKLEFFMRVRDVYLKRAALDTDRIKVIDAGKPLSVVIESVQTYLDELLGNL